MEEAIFKELFQRIVDQYELSSDKAAELLERILTILENTAFEHLQTDPKYEILIQDLERGDNL